jgi:hypothetical protein
MSADRWIPPKIMFLEPGDQPARGMAVKFAYLVRIKRQPWAYADLLEVHLPPDQANALPLDPARIVEETNSETGQKSFAYQAEPASP